jgi:hypothetical protein
MSLGRYAYALSLAGAVALAIAPRSATSPDFATWERARIRAHFDSVVGELREVNVQSLGNEQRRERSRIISELEAYRDRGVFPRNYVPASPPTPTFIDQRTGARCAVGHLVEGSGRGDIVRRVAAMNNHVYVMALGADSAFTGWLDQHGLTLVEAARIQLPYVAEPI